MSHKLLWDFDIHLILARRPDLILINKKRACKIVDFAVLIELGVKLKLKRKINTSNLLGNWKKMWNMKVMFIPIIIGVLGTVIKGFKKGPKDLEIKGRVKTIQTTALLRSASILTRGLENLRKLLVTQTPGKDHQLTLMWKNLKD